VRGLRWLPLLGLGTCLGCMSAGLNAGRERFYEGRPADAAAVLAETRVGDRDRVLLLMERGMVRQVGGDYGGSSADFNAASETIERLDYYSISRGAASMAINDRTLAFRGAPYEQALLHAFCALNYFALGLWDDAAVEARILVDRLSDLDGFPDEPFSRYVAGVAFEMIRVADGASIEYRNVDALVKALDIDAQSGRLWPVGAAPPGSAHDPAELICFLGLGRAPSELDGTRPRRAWNRIAYADIVVDGRLLGRTYQISNTARLLVGTQARMAALKTAKTVGRIVVKEVIAGSVAKQDSLLGQLLRLALYAAEVPDTRRWETLPLSLQVGRVPCPPDLTHYTLVFRDGAGRTIHARTVAAPLARRDRTFVSFAREL
jgi:hypothetical protein